MCWSQTLLAGSSSMLKGDEHKLEQMKFQIDVKEKYFLLVGHTITGKQAE